MLDVGTDIHGKTLGIVGTGRIGTAVEPRAVGFGMQALYTSKRRKPKMEQALGTRYIELEELLRQSDLVMLHLPPKTDTRHLIREAELMAMRKTAYLIKTSRGAVVNEEALVRALREAWIAGTALDVYEKEPDVHPEPLAMENVVPAPRMASASYETPAQMALVAAQNLLDVLQERRPKHLVDPEILGYLSRE